MQKTFPILVLSVFGLLALAISLRGFLAPASLGASLGYALSGVDGLNEVRAQYGGFFFAVAAVCALGVLRTGLREAALVVLAVVFGGVFLGRMVSLAIDGGFDGYGPVIRILFAVDLIGLLAAGSALVGYQARM